MPVLINGNFGVVNTLNQGPQGFQGIAGSGSGSGSVSGTTSQVAWFSNSTTVTSNTNLYWDNTNARLGIKSPVPAYTLDVTGDVRATISLGVGVAPSGTTGRIDASNDIIAYSSSDIRLKENVNPITNSLEKILKTRGVEFDWKEIHYQAHGNKGHDVGVIAQEIMDILPEAVRLNDNGFYAVRYEKIIPLLIEAIKEQQKQIDELKSLLKKGPQ
jgi:hypothetical protein